MNNGYCYNLLSEDSVQTDDECGFQSVNMLELLAVTWQKCV